MADIAPDEWRVGPPPHRPGRPDWRHGWDAGRAQCVAVALDIRDTTADPMAWSVASMILARLEGLKPQAPTRKEDHHGR